MTAISSMPYQGTKIHEEDLHEEKLLGKGTRAVVYKGTWNKATVPVAIKKWHIPWASGEEKQFNVFMMPSHPNIRSFFGIAGSNISVHEFIDHNLGDLFNTNIRVQYVVILKIGLGITNGLAFLHTQNVDPNLRSSNVFLTKDYSVKLGNFGEINGQDAFISNLRYLAPENFPDIDKVRDCKHKPNSDMFALGVLLWEMAACKHAYEPEFKGGLLERVDQLQQLKNGMQNPVPNCPSPYAKLINQCRDFDPDKRPSADNVRGELTRLIQQEEKKL